MSKYYIGVDYSSRKLAVVELYGSEQPLVKSIQFPRNKYPNRVHALTEIHYEFATFLGDLNRLDNVDIAIESPIMGMHGDVQTAVWMSMTAGGLVIAASDFGYWPMLVAPATWKKRIVGNGRATKEQIAEYIGNHLPVYDALCSNDDERDAMCLALYAELIDKERGDGRQEAEEAAGGR